MNGEASSKDGLTLGDLYRGLREQFAAAGVPEPEVSARRIAAEASGSDAADVALVPQTPMTLRMVAHADAMAARRVAGEPLQYVLGSWGFRKLDLAVDRRALIPRPETEVVAGIAIDWLTDAVRSGRLPAPRVADLGTGCGAIALSVAAEVPSARVYATDNSADALTLAAGNLAGLGRAAARISLHRGDWFRALEAVERDDPPVSASRAAVAPPQDARAVAAPNGPDSAVAAAINPQGGSNALRDAQQADAALGLRERLDVLISNPPYVADGEELPDEVRSWEPSEALFAGPDGLGAIRQIVREARGWLAPGGLLVIELAPDQSAAVVELATARGYEAPRVRTDLAGRDRVLVAQRPADEPMSATIEETAATLRYGGFAVAPTDTLCGIMARYADTDAVARVCEAKERPYSEPMPILVSGLTQADELVELSPAARSLAERHWPGGLTLVAKRRSGPDPLHGRDTLGVRAPAVGWLRWLIDEVGPVTGTSANRHGADTPTDAQTAAASLAIPPAAVIAGVASGGVASTVVDVTGPQPIILREGAVPRAEIIGSDLTGT